MAAAPHLFPGQIVSLDVRIHSCTQNKSLTGQIFPPRALRPFDVMEAVPLTHLSGRFRIEHGLRLQGVSPTESVSGA